MIKKHLLPSDLMSLVLKEFRAIHNANKWAPAVNSKHLSGAPPVVNMVSQPSGVQAIANPLVQVMSRRSETTAPSTSDRSYHHCGEVGHCKAACPKLSKGKAPKVKAPQEHHGHGKFKSQRNNPGRRDDNAWKITAPGVKEPHERTVKGRKFNWCDRCKHWTTSHSTATDIKNESSTLAANLVPDFRDFA
jgi:hypothetical protein